MDGDQGELALTGEMDQPVVAILEI